MRQLKVSPEFLARLHADPTPESEAAAAEAWQVLRALPRPADLPDFAQVAFSEDRLRIIVSHAQHHAGSSGNGCTELAMAGHAASVTFAMRCRDDQKQFEKFWAWWVSCGVVDAAKNHQQGDKNDTLNS